MVLLHVAASEAVLRLFKVSGEHVVPNRRLKLLRVVLRVVRVVLGTCVVPGICTMLIILADSAGNLSRTVLQPSDYVSIFLFL